MSGFGVGHRVVVRKDNGYDRVSQLTGSIGSSGMAGHYGKVVKADRTTGMVDVEITGRVGAPVNPATASIPSWLLFSHELEHAD